MKKTAPRPRPRPRAVLLVGPTASGKTPLGDLAAKRGLWGRRCLHFDFGENLRRAAASSGKANPFGLTARRLAVVRRSLAEGTLLEDSHFPIASTIFAGFLRAAGAGAADLVILNGLPRHAGQARDMERFVDVIAVIQLVASPAVIRERIRRDPAGDRAGRRDDSLAEVRRKSLIYNSRTNPLVDDYLERGALVFKIRVGARTTPDEMLTPLGKMGHFLGLVTA